MSTTWLDGEVISCPCCAASVRRAFAAPTATYAELSLISTEAARQHFDGCRESHDVVISVPRKVQP